MFAEIADFPESDVFSESSFASSVSGVGSTKSNRSSSSSGHRRHRHTAREKTSLRVGGRYEDYALLDTIKSIVQLIDRTQGWEIDSCLQLYHIVDDLEICKHHSIVAFSWLRR
jgi:hypothetical protein